MKCPHCLVEYHSNPTEEYLSKDVDGQWGTLSEICPHPKCRRLIVYLVKGIWTDAIRKWYRIDKVINVRPKGYSRAQLPQEVPDEFANDYKEACLVLADSPKASAALSRRCLQALLREIAKVKHGNLSNEIQEVLDSGKLPSYLSESIDAIRNIGNFAAHPEKSQKTGEIINVEPQEAEWNLEVLESLFDFYFVQPAKIKSKKDALNAKLNETGKKPTK